jgi:hypothetical protein
LIAHGAPGFSMTTARHVLGMLGAISEIVLCKEVKRREVEVERAATGYTQGAVELHCKIEPFYILLSHTADLSPLLAAPVML